MTQEHFDGEIIPPTNDGLSSLMHDLGNYIQIAISAVSVISRKAESLGSDSANAILAHGLNALDQASLIIRRTAAEDQAWFLEDTSIDACLTQLIPLFQYVCGPSVSVTYAVELLPKVRCARLGFQNALLNIVLNAKEAMPDGGNVSIGQTLI